MNIFRITDGTTTISLLGGSPILGVTYVPDAPSPEVARFASSLMDGDTINAIARHNVTETVSLVLEGTSTAMESLRTNIQRMMWQAEQRQQTGTGAIVYVEYEETSASDTYRSELIGGAVEYASAVARRTRSDSESTVELLIHWERMWYWESTTETQVATRIKGASSYTVSAKTIRNQETFDANNYGNFVEISSTGVGGDLPAPARIVLKNLSLADRALTEYLFFNSWRIQDYAGGQLWLELEGGTNATTVSDATCSGGSKSRNTVNAAGAMDSIPVSALPVTADRLYFLPVIRFSAFTANKVWARFGLISYLHGYADLGVDTEEQLLTNSSDLQIFQAIPVMAKGTLELLLAMRSEDTITVDGDYLFMAPTDSVRILRTVGLKLVVSGKMIDYGNGVTELLDNLDVNYGFVTPLGSPLMLMPGVFQRVHFLASGDGSSPFWNFELSLFYRKRVLVP